MGTYTDRFSGNLVWPAYSFGQTISLTSNLTLSWPNQFQDNNLVVTNIMQVAPDAGGRTLTMPDATQTSNFISSLIINTGAFTFTLLDNAGGTILSSTAGSSTFVYLSDNTTVAGTWHTNPSGGGYVAVTSVAAVAAAGATANNLSITGSPITTTGTFTFTLQHDLLALSSFGASVGIVARTASNTFALRSIVGTSSQITVTNGDGVAGNPTISLPSSITGINSLTVGNLSLSANTIASTNLNGAITLAPNGTGIIELTNNTNIKLGSELKFYNPAGSHYIGFSAGVMGVDVDLTWPTVAPVLGQVLEYSGVNTLGWANVTTFGGPSTINALARYSNITGSLKDSTIIVDDAGNITGPASIIVGDIGIGTIDAQTITTTSANENLKLSPNGAGQVSGPVGAINAPGYTFTGRTTTGMWSSGANVMDFSTNAYRVVSMLASPASSVNYLTMQASATGNPSIIGTAGTDTDVGVKFSLKGAGQIQAPVGSEAQPAYTFTGDLTTGMWHSGSGTISWSTNSNKRMTLDIRGNLGIGTATFDGTAGYTLTLGNATAPAGSLTDALQVYSSDITAGNTSLAWYGEGNGGVSVVSPTSPNRTIAIIINGTTYYVSAKTTND